MRPVVATPLDRSTDRLREQGHQNTTNFRMRRDQRRKRTTVPLDQHGSVAADHFRQTAHLSHQRQRRVQTGPHALRPVVTRRGTAADLREQRLHLRRTQTLGQDPQQTGEYGIVRLREEPLRLVRETIQVRGLPHTPPYPAPLDEPVTLQRRQMRPDRIVRQPERRRQLVHRTLRTPQQDDDLAPCARQKALPTPHAASFTWDPHSTYSNFPHLSIYSRKLLTYWGLGRSVSIRSVLAGEARGFTVP